MANGSTRAVHGPTSEMGHHVTQPEQKPLEIPIDPADRGYGDLGDALRKVGVREDTASGELSAICFLRRTILTALGSSQKLLNRTVSGIEERAAQLRRTGTFCFERFGRPDVAAAEADVFPTERSDVGE